MHSRNEDYMEDKHIFRSEYKYIVSLQEIMVLKTRIENIASLDRYAGDTSAYTVRSLYFDDYNNSCYADNENGVDCRDKYRARIYNKDSERIRLEIKHKEQGLGYKDSAIVSKREFREYLEGGRWNSDNKVLNRYMLMREQKGLHPVVIIEYDRIPYVYKPGNVRITFDMNISSSSYVDMFCMNDVYKRPIMPPGQHVMEVKFDGMLPDVIKQVLNIGELRRTSYSKYYLCRKYTVG